MAEQDGVERVQEVPQEERQYSESESLEDASEFPLTALPRPAIEQDKSEKEQDEHYRTRKQNKTEQNYTRYYRKRGSDPPEQLRVIRERFHGTWKESVKDRVDLHIGGEFFKATVDGKSSHDIMFGIAAPDGFVTTVELEQVVVRRFSLDGELLASRWYGLCDDGMLRIKDIVMGWKHQRWYYVRTEEPTPPTSIRDTIKGTWKNTSDPETTVTIHVEGIRIFFHWSFGMKYDGVFGGEDLDAQFSVRDNKIVERKQRYQEEWSMEEGKLVRITKFPDLDDENTVFERV